MLVKSGYFIFKTEYDQIEDKFLLLWIRFDKHLIRTFENVKRSLKDATDLSIMTLEF